MACKRILTLVVSIAVLGLTHIEGGDAQEGPKELYATELGADFVIPESPGLSVLGLDPSIAAHPKSPRELATSLLNGVDAQGNFQTGVAVDTAPFLLLLGGDVTRQEYLDHYEDRALFRLQTSIAVTKGTEQDDKSARLGIGFRWVPIDAGDPRQDQMLADCLFGVLTDKAHEVSEETKNVPPGPESELAFTKTVERINAEGKYSSRVEQCRKESGRRLWNRSALTLGAAPTWIAPEGSLSNINSSGGTFWTSVSYGFDRFDETYDRKRASQVAAWLHDHAEALVGFRYLLDQELPSPADSSKTIRQDNLFAGGALRVGAQWGALTAEAAFVRTNPDHVAADDYYTLSVRGDLRILADLWLSLSAGGEGGRDGSDNHTFILSSLKWSFPEAPAFARNL